MMKAGCAVLAFVIVLAAGATAAEEPKFALPTLFGDNMVFQQDAKLPVWGTAEPGEQVTVTLADRTATATAAEDGSWAVSLDPLKAGGPHELTVAGKKTVAIKNVMVGEVWFCSGQSNMDFKLSSAINAEKEIAESTNPDLRLGFGRWALGKEPQHDPRCTWAPSSPEKAKDYSAVAYFFGRDIQKNLGVPVGLIWVSQGWTPSEAWTSREALASDPEIKRDVLDRWDARMADFPARRAEYDKKLEEWKKAGADAKAAGKEFTTREPTKPPDPDFYHRATSLYNGGVAPYTPFPIRGVIWYQGETNADRGIQYRKLFPILIADWRKAWNQPEMPFLFVQIANLGPPQVNPDQNDRAELREAQMLTMKTVPNTAMTVTVDIGDANDEHPKNKQDVGARLALGARALAYGQKIVYSGPVYDSMKVEGSSIRLSFTHVGGGLVARDGKLAGFSIAGDDRKFVWADAKIDGGTIVVSSGKVARPAAVRYGWAMNPIISLFNKEGLPASPFRTDDWPGVTTGNIKFWIDTIAQ